MKPNERIRHLGKIGQIACVLTGLLVITLLIVALFVEGLAISLSAIFGVDPISNSLSCISFESLKDFLSSVLPYAQMIFEVLGFVVIYLIFRQFAKGYVLTMKIAKRIKWFGIWCVLSAFYISYDYSYLITKENIVEGTRTGVIHEELGFSCDPHLILIGVLILSIGYAMHHGTEVEEENALTV